MAASDEWEDMHLTPVGWVQGSCKLDYGGLKEVATPTNRLVTVHRSAYCGAIGAPSSASVEESVTYCAADKDAVIRALLKHGKPKFSV